MNFERTLFDPTTLSQKIKIKYKFIIWRFSEAFLYLTIFKLSRKIFTNVSKHNVFTRVQKFFIIQANQFVLGNYVESSFDLCTAEIFRLTLKSYTIPQGIAKYFKTVKIYFDNLQDKKVKKRETKQTSRQTEKQTIRKTDSQTNKQMNRQTETKL